MSKKSVVITPSSYNFTPTKDFTPTYPKEATRNSCVIIAFANALGYEFKFAKSIIHRMVLHWGEHDYHNEEFVIRFFNYRHYKIIFETPKTKLYGSRYYAPNANETNNPTIHDFMDAHPQGTYLIIIDGHCTCVKDGKLLDAWDCGSNRIKYAWCVAGPERPERPFKA